MDEESQNTLRDLVEGWGAEMYGVGRVEATGWAVDEDGYFVVSYAIDGVVGDEYQTLSVNPETGRVSMMRHHV